MHDIVLLQVPFTIIETPPLGIAVLKGAIQDAGLKCYTVDLGMELFKFGNCDRELFERTQGYFVIPNLQTDRTITEKINAFIDSWAEKLNAMPTRWIGFSVFSYYSHLATYMLCERLHNLKSDKKIVIGGPGAFIKISDAMVHAYGISKLERTISFSDILKKRGLVAEIIRGDGEQALIDLLRGQSVQDEFHMESYRGKKYPFADFDDFDIPSYTGQREGYPQLPMFTSKGCVRNCDFCDVGVVQNRYRFRHGENIFKEMVHLADKYNIRNMLFFDSLVNGNMKSMREWVGLLADYNRKNPNKRISWSALGWICRPIGQIPVSFYPTLAESGLDVVSIGVETGSNNVLKAMDKKTNVEALYFEAEQFRKNGIKFIPLLMVGHWSEQWEDFLQTCEMIARLAPLVKTGNIVAVDPGVPFVVLSDTPSDKNHTQNNMVVKRSQLWYCFDNPSLTAKERYQRLLLLDRIISHFNIPIQDRQLFAALVHRVRDMLPEFQDFYGKIVSEQINLPKQQSRYYLENFDEFVDLILARIPRSSQVKIKLVVESFEVNGPPKLDIICNNVSQTSILQAGIHEITLTAAVLDKNKIQIKFSGKNDNDTVIDEQGNIIRDKCVIIKNFYIDDFDIFNDPEFFYKKLGYKEHDKIVDTKHGFWIDQSEMTLSWTGVFEPWYCHNSVKNSQFDVFLVTNAQVPKTQKKYTKKFKGDREELLSLLDTMNY
jgi:hypothetical protein